MLENNARLAKRKDGKLDKVEHAEDVTQCMTQEKKR